MGKILNNPARTLGIIAVASAAATIAMTMSLPYRIHQGIYTWYIWTGRLLPFISITTLAALAGAFVLGISSRQRAPILLTAISCIIWFFSMSHQMVHSGPNLRAWCYNHLRETEAAKAQFALENHLTNGQPSPRSKSPNI